jgi:multidrug efflux pump subunit AcrA (membrane-fusion protein)
MKNKWLYAAVAACLLAASGCSKKEQSETEAPAPVQVTAVTQEPIRHIVAGDGVLFPQDQTSVMPNISKPVLKFYANRGDHVKQGQLLAVLESRDLAAAVANAKSQLNQAELNLHTVELASVPESVVKAETDVESDKQQLDAAQKLLDSQTELFRQGALAGRRVDEARVQFVTAKTQLQAAQEHLRALNSVSKGDQISTARAQVQTAQAQLQAADAQLGYAEIHSPKSGVIADRPIYEGEMAVPGTPLITVVDISRVVARINIPQNQGNLIKVGQPAEVIQADSGQQVSGKVVVVSPATDANSTTLQVWVQAENPGERLKPGSSVHVKVITEQFKNATTVPAAAILPGETGGTAVLVIIDSVAHRRTVQVGVREGDKVQILNGCRPGEEVVTVGGLGVDDKGKVKVIDTSVQEADDEDQNPPPAADSKKDQKKDEAKPKAK